MARALAPKGLLIDNGCTKGCCPSRCYYEECAPLRGRNAPNRTAEPCSGLTAKAPRLPQVGRKPSEGTKISPPGVLKDASSPKGSTQDRLLYRTVGMLIQEERNSERSASPKGQNFFLLFSRSEKVCEVCALFQEHTHLSYNHVRKHPR